MIGDATEDSVDLWRQVASAVEYIAAVERSGFTVWDAITAAIAEWNSAEPCADGAPCCGQFVEPDYLRSTLRDLLNLAPPFGAPGGVSLEGLLFAALSEWVATQSARVNQGRAFSLHRG